MKEMTQLCKLQEEITCQITEERNREMAESIAAKRAEAEAAEKEYHKEIKSLEAMGLNVSNLDALDRERCAEADEELEVIKAQMEALSQEPSPVAAEVDVEGSFLPEGACMLTPSWTALFSDQDIQDQLTGGSAIEAQATVSAGGGCKNYWNWAKGGGWGCTGGVGSNQQWAEWGFWYKPPTSRFYSIRPYFQYRGFYIVRANDKWYNCKKAQVLVSAWTNVHQYNWKGWNHVNVLNVRDDNINVNRRFDTNRYTYNSYLLGAGDWAFIRCTIGLYVRAQGSGSYAENNFSTGAANKLCVPHVHVY
jgi:hypothetical protein